MGVVNTFGSLRFVECDRIPEGKVACMKDGKCIWYGNFMDPWDDVECDTVLVSVVDYQILWEEWQTMEQK